jgi:outer membrane protein
VLPSFRLIALAPQPAFAETIYQAMAKAYENNPDLNAARAGLRATDEGVALAKSGYRPFIGAEATTTSTNARPGDQFRQCRRIDHADAV